MALDWVQQALEAGLGFAPYPATLNLRPESAEDLSGWRRIQAEIRGIELAPMNRDFCNARLFPVRIIGVGENQTMRGGVLLPEVGGYPPDKIEVVAPARIKEALRVRDGDQLTLEFIN